LRGADDRLVHLPGSQAKRLKLSGAQPEALQQLTRSQTMEYRLRFRAQTPLLADGQTVSAVARRLSTTRLTIKKWRDRYQQSALIPVFWLTGYPNPTTQPQKPHPRNGPIGSP
jgi:hypothetical protein